MFKWGLKVEARKACLLFCLFLAAAAALPSFQTTSIEQSESRAAAHRRRERVGMARGDAMVEHDFFQIEKLKAASFRAADGKSAGRSRIQSVVSRINPQLLRSVIAPGAAEMPPGKAALLLSSSSSPPPPQPVMILNPSIRSVAEISNETAPLTIFYNGSMAVFDLPRDKAETILKLAETANDGSSIDPTKGIRLPEELDGELLPMARRKSLQRFIAKRKQRLTEAGPYAKEEAVENPAMDMTFGIVSASSF